MDQALACADSKRPNRSAQTEPLLIRRMGNTFDLNEMIRRSREYSRENWALLVGRTLACYCH
jgi:hypothetical protein